jgi:hypothetical protein
MQKRVGALAIALASVVACGKEIGRVALTGEGEGDTTVTVAAGDKLALWTSLDVAWTGSWDARYAVELRDSTGAAVAKATCDPLVAPTKTSSVITNVGGHHTASYQGKMSCELDAPSAGAFTVHTKLTYAGKPVDLKVKDISLVVKK